MLPGAAGSRRFHGKSLLPEYFRRMLHYPQMDVEYTFWQMFYLCVRPSTVYRTIKWHKQTKNQWARDDPGFVAILAFFIAIASVSYAVAFKMDSFFQVLWIMFSTILVDFLTVGCIVATIGWWAANKYLRVHGIHSVEQKVEWLYSFDVHCNSFFPLFLLLYVFQFFLLPVLLMHGFIATILANSLYMVAFVYYTYITFLGYKALPFLQNAVYFLYPSVLVGLVYIVSILFNLNICHFVMQAYFGH